MPRRWPALDAERAAFVAERLAELTPDVQIVAEGVQRFQVRPREMRRAVVVTRAAMLHAASPDAEALRAQVFAGLQRIYTKALLLEPPALRSALDALGQIVRLFGLDAAERVNLAVSGLDLRDGAVTALSKVKERLAELRAADAAKKDN